jgi:GDP-4-dehydro-6-deoxy-D-mannose reductase
VTADFAAQIAAIEAVRQDPVLRVGNLTTARDFTDVRDVVRAYRLLMEKNDVGGVFNVASGKAQVIQDLLNSLLELSTAEIQIEQDPALLRPIDVPVLVGDASRLNAATGWQPTIPVEESLRDILDYWRGQGT